MTTAVELARAATAADEILVRHPGKQPSESTHDASLSDLARAVLSVDEEIPDDEARTALFQPGVEPSRRHLIAAALARFLATRRSLGTDLTFRAKTFALFDAEFADTLYRPAQINPKDQTVTKEPAIAEYVLAIPDRVMDTLDLLQTVSDVPHFRQEFMKLLNNGGIRAIIEPFLPAFVYSQRFNELFRILDDICDSHGPDLVTAHARLNRELDVLLEETASCRTSTCEMILGGLERRARRAGEEAFAASDATKPARLGLSTTAKKYPLHQPTDELLLTFALHNDGEGVGFNVDIRFAEAEGVSLGVNDISVGEVAPGTTQVSVVARLASPTDVAHIVGELSWRDGDDTPQRHEFLLELPAQETDRDWDRMAIMDPYALEPVTNAGDLVGRGELLTSLFAKADASSIGNAFVTGQKRVGKTSVVKAFESELVDRSDYLTVYLETGDIAAPNAGVTVATLGRTLAQRLRARLPADLELTVPDFSDALSPLADFIDKLNAIAPQKRIVIVIDEFDELPIDVYHRGGVGDALFLTLRSLSGRAFVGFVLVGGEKIDFILKHQGERLNKFSTHRVDYFSSDGHYRDFAELLRRPSENHIELSDDAIACVYDWTAGNPYFAKLICNSMWRLVVSRRDAHVTANEIEIAARKALGEVGIQAFQHFWDDGIFEEGSRAEDIAIRRRKTILAVGEAIRASSDGADYKRARAPLGSIVTRAAAYGLDDSPVRDELRDFTRRGVLEARGDEYRCTVPFFEAWLQEHGVQAIITSFGEAEAIFVRRRREEADQVLSEEIINAVDRWGIYKGQRVGEDRVRAWLRQVGDPRSQRLMFRLLESVRFYGGDAIRQKLREVGAMVDRATDPSDPKAPRRRNYVLSYLGPEGKSGPYYARLFAQENELPAAAVAPRAELTEHLKRAQPPRALIFVDDFLGSGGTIMKYLDELQEQLGEMLVATGTPVFFVSVAGMDAGVRAVEAAAAEAGFPISVMTADLLGEEAQAFSAASPIFRTENERAAAEALARDHGMRLEPRYPLGYADSQALVVFESSCPNNSLPILWQKTKDWKPLFPRY